MTAFIPPGFIALADFDGDRTTLRQRLASGELHAFVPDMTGELIAILPKYWIVDSCQTWLDTGKFYDEQWRKYFPIWIKMPAPATVTKPASVSKKRGPEPKKRERIKEKIRAAGLDTVKGWGEESAAKKFGVSRDTLRGAIKELESENTDKTPTKLQQRKK
jgi:hypothetical protein